MGEAFGIQAPVKKLDLDIATHIHVKNDGPKRSLLCIETEDRPGLLLEVIKIMAHVNITVESAEIDTEGLIVKDKFHVSYSGATLNDSLSQIIRQLIVSGFPSDEKSLQEVRPVKEVCPLLLKAIQSLLPYYSSFREHHLKFYEFIRNACTKVMKILVAIQTRHPFSFGDQSVLPVVMDFCLNKITDPEPEIMSYDKFVIKCMSMAKIVLECKVYKPIMTGRVIDENAITLEQRKKNISRAVSGVLTSLLPNDRVILLCNVLIRRGLATQLLHGNPRILSCLDYIYICWNLLHPRTISGALAWLVSKSMKYLPTMWVVLLPVLLCVLEG